MRNDPDPQKYLRQGLLPLHSRVMGLFDTVKDTHHQCAMDNLYNSAAFCKAAYNHDNKVLCHGVTRRGMRGIPPHVQQAEVKSRKDQILVRGTVKAAVLERDADCPNLVASSVYDSKPVHYLSMVSEKLEWSQVEKNVYNVDSGETEVLKFLRLNNIDKYNKEMGNVDLADQLRGTYRVDHWVRNRKWWWSIFFWSLGVMLTNAYVMYCKVNIEEYGVSKSELMSQREFRECICKYWINPIEYADEQRMEPYLRKRSSTSTASDISSITEDATQQQQTNTHMFENARHINDESLKYPNGNLKCRMDWTLDHLPTPSNARARCGLHRWFGVETQKQVLSCRTCQVHLCAHCYRLFHRMEDIANQKEYLRPIVMSFTPSRKKQKTPTKKK